MNTQPAFGVHSEVGQLRKVMVCSPGRAHQRLTPSNCDALLFDDVIWVETAKRDHLDFQQKMRDRGIDVVEMHELLTQTLGMPEARQWILDTRVTENEVGLGFVNEVRSFLEGLSDRELAETLIGGLSVEEFPESSLQRPDEPGAPQPGDHAVPRSRPCRTRSTRGTRPAGSMAGAASIRFSGRRARTRRFWPRRSTGSILTSPAR